MGKLLISFHKLIKDIYDIVIEIMMAIMFVIKSNLYSALIIIELISPMIIVGLAKRLDEDVFSLRMFLVWLIIFLAIYILKRLMNKQNCGYDFPIPRKRFTKVDDFGECSISNDDIQEVILYLADVEDYLEKIGKL